MRDGQSGVGFAVKHFRNGQQTREKGMTKIRTIIGAAVAAGILVAGLAACEKKEGPAERAGKEIDKSIESAGKQLEKAGQKIQDAAQDAKK
jgi:hypothetical protein